MASSEIAVTFFAAQLLHQLWIDKRLQDPDNHLAGAKGFDICVGRLLDARDHISVAIKIVARDDTGAGVHVQAIRNRRAIAGAVLDENLRAGRDQRFERIGHKRDAPLVGRTLFCHTYLHWDPWA